jgi:YggT family protein
LVKQNAAETIALWGGSRYLCLSFDPGAAMTSLFQILLLILDIAKWLVLAHVIMSWLINFQVLNTRQPLVYQIWTGLSRLLEPAYAQVRRILPAMSGIDLAPLVVLVAIYALRIVLYNNAAAFY